METSKKLKATIFNIQRFSLQDGPGIRTTVFFKGCPLKCIWCSNKESQNYFPEVAHRDSLCNGCENCLAECSKGAISISSNNKAYNIKINRETCTNCGQCVDACKSGALQIYGKSRTVDEVFEIIKRDSLFYINSGGGVTASGGEPLEQADFLYQLFKNCQSVGIHTTLDTSGYANEADLIKILPVTNLVLFDLKLMNNDKHMEFTGRSNDQILKNARIIMDKGIEMIIRIPLLPGINDSDENLSETAKFVANHGKDVSLNLLPYHRFGESKYKMLDCAYQLTSLISPTEEKLQNAINIFRSIGLHCTIQR